MPDKAPPGPLKFTIERRGDTVLVRCSGKLVSGVSDCFYFEVSQQIPGTKRMVLDFTDITHMDSMGIGALVRLYVSSKSAGCSLQLNNVGKSVRQLLGVTHLMSVFSVIAENNIRFG